MPTPLSSGSVSSVSLSGSTLVDGLIGGTRWTSTTVSYSFGTSSSIWSTDSWDGYGARSGSGEPWHGYATLSSANQSAVRSALAEWSEVSKLQFKAVTETASAVGDLRFAFSSNVSGGFAAAYYPYQGAIGGDVWFDTQGSMRTSAWVKGSYEYMALLHEIGHSLGLKHPFDVQDDNSTVLPESYDSRSYTVMSYSAAPGDQNTYFSYEPTTPMLLDIQAIQRIYGARATHNSGDDTYVFRGSSTYHETLWDSGGSDTLRYDASTGGTLNLNAGAASKLGQAVYIENAYGASLGTVNNVWIAYGSTIENAIGGSGSDKLIGNRVANRLDGGNGNDTIDGGGGNDRLQGQSGNDRMNGGSGDDLLYGYTGADNLTGGSGHDRFVFTTAPNASSNVDTVTDFVAADDRFDLDSAAFHGIGADGQLAASAFRLGSAAGDANDRVLYDSASGTLRFDADGTGPDAAVVFAKVDPGTGLTVADFWVV